MSEPIIHEGMPQEAFVERLAFWLWHYAEEARVRLGLIGIGEIGSWEALDDDGRALHRHTALLLIEDAVVEPGKLLAWQWVRDKREFQERFNG